MQWTALPTLASTRFAGLYDVRSRVRNALTTIGRALDANRTVDTIPASRATFAPVMVLTLGSRPHPPRRTECAICLSRLYVVCRRQRKAARPWPGERLSDERSASGAGALLLHAGDRGRAVDAVLAGCLGGHLRLDVTALGQDLQGGDDDRFGVHLEVSPGRGPGVRQAP